MGSGASRIHAWGEPDARKDTESRSLTWRSASASYSRRFFVPTFRPPPRQAVTSDELYGYMTLAKEWKDGVLSIIMRNMSKEWAPFGLHQDMKWVILDGDIDAVWIESMNTVMDDNKVRLRTETHTAGFPPWRTSFCRGRANFQ